MGKSKIFLWCEPWKDSDVIASALCADGTMLDTNIVYSEEYAKADMGYTTVKNHNLYREHCPDGFTLEWVDEPYNHNELIAALDLASAKGF